MLSDPALNLAKLGLIEGMKVLDIGAGSGFYSITAARKVGLTGRVYSLDIQKDLLERLRKSALAQGLNNLEVIWGNAEKIGGTKVREGLIDRVIVSNVLNQIEAPDDFSLEMKRVLKPRGKILIVDYNEVGALSPKHAISAETARGIFEKNGFQFESAFEAGEHYYGLVMTRI